MDTNEFLETIYKRIDSIVRIAVKDALEQALKSKPAVEQKKDDDFLSAEEAAHFLKIKLSSLYSKVEKSDFPHYRSGKRKLLFKKAELEAYVAARRCKSQNEINKEVEDHILKNPIRII